jgi:phosphoglycerate dehydrogenase-like enzyme
LGVKVVIAGRANERDVQALRAAYRDVEFVVAPAHGPELLAAAADADALSIHTVEPDVFRAAQRLRWVQSQGAGVEWMLFTPHCSGSSRPTTEGAWRVFAENVGRFVRGEPLENVVDKKRGY